MISMSLILQTATRLLMPLLLVFSVFLLLRGHNEPGGGFIAGLMAASAFALHAVAFGVPATLQLLRFDPHTIIGGGLLAALASGIPGMLLGEPFMTGLWWTFYIEELAIKLSTVLLFDIGVYLVVLGVTCTIILVLAEEE
jgi:multicomponent Na+:H+ antiporter subunit B